MLNTCDATTSTFVEPVSKGKLFVVLARPRTGSSLLISKLQSHPAIASGSEILGQLKGRSQWGILMDAFTADPMNPEIKARGFKLFYRHPFDGDPARLFAALSRIPSLHIIRLRRRNLLRSLVSLKIAMAHDHWHVRSPEQRVPAQFKRTTMTAEELERKFEEVVQMEAGCDKYFGNHPVLPVHYEDMMGAPSLTFSRVCEFLGVEYSEPTSNLIRQNPEPLNELLENFDELKKEFSGTRWGNFFD